MSTPETEINPNSKRVFIFEDDKNIVTVLGRRIERAGHTVEGVAGTFQDAMNLIQGAFSGELAMPDVVITDGNLDKTRFDNYHGSALAKLVKELLPGVVCIGYPGQEMIDNAGVTIVKTLQDVYPEVNSYNVVVEYISQLGSREGAQD